MKKNQSTRGSLPRCAKGFTLIELIVVITIMVILSSVLLTRIYYYQERAEKAAMEQVASALQSALTLKHARLITQGLESNATLLAAENPMNWLAKIPSNYAGEFYDVTPRAVAPGNWVFDLKTRNLIYVVDRGDHFTPGKDGHKWVRYHVNALHEAAPAASGKNRNELVGMLFEPIERFEWFD